MTCLLLFGALHAEMPAQIVGGTEFLQLGAGGRALALGGAYVALANDPSSVLWNPAGLARTRRVQGYLSHMTLYRSQAAHNFAVGTVEISPGLVLGLSWVRLSIDDIPRFSALQGSRFDRLRDRPEWRSTGEAEGSFRSADNAFFFSVARRYRFNLMFGQGLTLLTVPLELSFGMNMKLLRRNLDQASASAQSLDLGMLISFGRRASGRMARVFSFGLSIFDLAATRLNWNTGSGYADPIPVRVQAGAAMRQRLPGEAGVLAITLTQNLLAVQQPRAGLEYQLGRTLSLRVGYRPEGWSAGAGLTFGRVMFDYAFSVHELGATHRIGGGARF